MRTDEGTSIALPASYLHADTNVHAYAATIHKAHGTTVDRAFIEAADRLSREPANTASHAARRRTASTSRTPSPKKPTTATTTPTTLAKNSPATSNAAKPNNSPSNTTTASSSDGPSTDPTAAASAADPQTETIEHDAFRERDAPCPYVEDMRPTSLAARSNDSDLIPYRPDRLAISVSEAAAVLGCSVSTVYRMIRSAQLRSARSTANGRIFVNLQSVRDFVDGEAGCAAALASERKRQLG